MIDVEFAVSPSGLFGMNKLAEFLNMMKDREEIADWLPCRAVTESKGARYIVRFANDEDAARAAAQWARDASNTA